MEVGEKLEDGSSIPALLESSPATWRNFAFHSSAATRFNAFLHETHEIPTVSIRRTSKSWTEVQAPLAQ